MGRFFFKKGDYINSISGVKGILDPFSRTRLTHSIEVAQISVAIINHINTKFCEKLSRLSLNINRDLIESISIAHDIGHPPFGHGGEIALNYMMREHGGFEGNGQTLRITTKLEKYSEKNGMNLTRRTLLGLLKYPCSFSETWNDSIERKKEEIHFHNLNQEH